MIKDSKSISVEGFKTKDEFNKWLIEQGEREPNDNVLKTFKWFLMKVEQADKSRPADIKDINILEKYAKKVIDKKIMSEKNVIRFICQAQEIELEERNIE